MIERTTACIAYGRRRYAMKPQNRCLEMIGGRVSTLKLALRGDGIASITFYGLLGYPYSYSCSTSVLLTQM